MAKKIIIFIFIFLILISTILFFYFKYEKSKVDKKLEVADLNIIAEVNNKNIKTGFIIFVNGIKQLENETVIGGAVLQQVPLNSTIIIFNKNIDNQTYYITSNEFYTTSREPYRILLKPINRGNLSFNQIGNLSIDENINLTIKSDGKFQEGLFCLRWGIHTIYVKVLNLTEVEVPNIGLFDKCFNIVTLDNQDYSINFEHKAFNILDEKDFVNVTFFDSEQTFLDINRKYTQRYVYQLK